MLLGDALVVLFVLILGSVLVYLGQWASWR